MALEGWERLSPGRYRNPAGEEVSRRQYDNARLQAMGYRNRSELERLRDDSTFRYFARLIAEREGRSRRAIVRAESDYTKLAAKAKRDEWGKRTRGRGAKQPMARILTRAGKRDPAATNRLGEYERIRRGRRR